MKFTVAVCVALFCVYQVTSLEWPVNEEAEAGTAIVSGCFDQCRTNLPVEQCDKLQFVASHVSNETEFWGVANDLADLLCFEVCAEAGFQLSPGFHAILGLPEYNEQA